MDSLNTLIQLFAAIYVTITFDDLLFRRFWTANKYQMVVSNFNSYQFQLSTPRTNEILQQVKVSTTREEYVSRLRGGYMLLACISFLLFNVFYDTSDLLMTGGEITLFAMVVYHIMAILVLEFWGGRLFWMVLIFTGSIVIYVLVSILETQVNEVIGPIISEYLLKWLIVALVMCPVFMRLFALWLYSNIYIDRLRYCTDVEYKNYTSSLKAVETHDRSLLHESYKGALIDSFFESLSTQSTSSQDVCLGPLAQHLADHLRKIYSPPSKMALLLFGLKHFISKGANDKVDISKSSIFQFNSSDKTVLNPKHYKILSESEMDTLCSEYEKINPKPPFKHFCEQNNADYTKVKAYRKNWLKNKR